MGLLGKRGTLLKMNILHFGDCLEVMKLMPDKSVDMILCDLPYGTTACKWDSVIPFKNYGMNIKELLKIMQQFVYLVSNHLRQI